MTTAAMHPSRYFLLSICLLSLRPDVVSATAGPVYINPSAIQQQAVVAPTQNGGSFVTKTVYGFLDFTTTIGNTVMVFSPQSAAVPEPAKKSAVPSTNTVIDTKPPAQPKATLTIKPSKTVIEATEIKENRPSSIVNVVAEPPKSSKVVVLADRPSSVVNVVEGPASSAAPLVHSKVEVVTAAEVKPTVQAKVPQIYSSRVEVVSEEPIVTAATPSVALSSVVTVQSSQDGNNVNAEAEYLEYDILTKEPSEKVEETYKVISLKPSSKFHLKPRLPGETKSKLVFSSQNKKPESGHPTGLVTRLSGTVVRDGATTVHETSVIGTYISGKYAQVLQSTSQIIAGQKAKISPSPTLRILKTAAPNLSKQQKHLHLEPTPAGSVNEETALPVEALFNAPGNSNFIRSTKRPSVGLRNDFKARFKNRKIDVDLDDDVEEQEQPSYKKQPLRSRPTPSSRSFKPTKFGRSSAEPLATVSVFGEPASSSSGRRYQTRKNKGPRSSTYASSSSAPGDAGFTRRGYKPRISPSSADALGAQSTSVYKFKLNRAPGRWQYKTTPKPRVTIRKHNNELDAQPTTPSQFQDAPQFNDVVTPVSRSDNIDLSPLSSENTAANFDEHDAAENKLDDAFPLETIKVEISTPADFNNIYYEIATVKSPYTFQVGSVKNTRYITVTSTIEKSFETETPIMSTPVEPLTENILATSNNYAKDNNLDSVIATLPPLILASDMETPPLETFTETFSTTQEMLKTHILPVIYAGGNATTSLSLVQTYHVTRLVTATKTLPPMEAYHFVPSKTLKDFNSHLDEAGSELHLELEFGDNNDQDEQDRQTTLPSDLNLANIGSDFDLSDVDKSKFPDMHLRHKKNPVIPKPTSQLNDVTPTPSLSPEQLQQLALLRFLNPGQPQVVTTSKPVLKVETVFESHVIPIFNGQSTIFTTISRPVATTSKTEYEISTSTVAALPQLPPVNPLFPVPQAQFAVTSTPVVTQTVVTQTDSKVLKLTFGAKTAYTTIFSTRVIPTALTTYLTASVPVQPTAAFPGFFPAPYPPFPYVG